MAFTMWGRLTRSRATLRGGGVGCLLERSARAVETVHINSKHIRACRRIPAIRFAGAKVAKNVSMNEAENQSGTIQPAAQLQPAPETEDRAAWHTLHRAQAAHRVFRFL